MATRKYTIVIDPWPDKKGFTITVPSLPGCITQAHTLAEARKRAKEAIQCHIEGLMADSLPVPEERDKPALITIAV